MSYKQCVKCVMDTTDPDITFNEKGVCNHCIDYRVRERQRKIDKLELPWIIYKIKKEGKCLLGLSGGVDSSMCLHYLVEQGIKPLCFSVDNGYNDPKADENIMRLVEGLKVPFKRIVLDLEEFKELQKAFEKSQTLNIEIPTDHVLMALTYKMAKDNGIKYVISGGNLSTESIMPKSWGYQAKDLTFIKSIYGKKIKHLPTISLIKYIWCRFIKKIKIINLLDFYEYNREESIKLLSEKYGYQSYGEKHHESNYTKWFQEEYLPRFGIIKDKAHYSSLINSKQMTKEKALELLSNKKIGNEIPRSYKEFKNSEYWWNLLSKIYAYFKRF